MTNVFVLGTGRCGTTTFIEACRHLTNFTAGHETNGHVYGEARFAYPDDHIEADNRLTWFLPQLGTAMADRDITWVHLKRDREATARSFLKRLDPKRRASIITAFAHAMIMHGRPWPEEDHLGLCLFYVDTVTAQIDSFLRDKPHRVMQMETAAQEFPSFLDDIGAEGNLNAAVAEWAIAHNRS